MQLDVLMAVRVQADLTVGIKNTLHNSIDNSHEWPHFDGIYTLETNHII